MYEKTNLINQITNLTIYLMFLSAKLRRKVELHKKLQPNRLNFQPIARFYFLKNPEITKSLQKRLPFAKKTLSLPTYKLGNYLFLLS